MNARLQYLIELVVSIYFVAYLLPNAIGTLVNITIPNAPAGITTLLTTFIPIVVILGVVLLLMPEDIRSKVGLHIELVQEAPREIEMFVAPVSVMAVSNFEQIGS